jgi:hypothetical protein
LREVALPPLRPAAFFCAVEPPRLEAAFAREVVDFARDVVDFALEAVADFAREAVDFAREVVDFAVDFAREVADLAREVAGFARDVADLAREAVDFAREVVDLARDVPDVERARDVVLLAERFAAVVFPPLLPAAFFCAVEPPRLAVERAELRDVPEAERDRLVPLDLLDLRGVAARTREMVSSLCSPALRCWSW